MKKLLIILCACAILLSCAACKKNTVNTPDDTSDIIGNDTQVKETIDLDGDGVSDGYVIEGSNGSEADGTDDPDAVIVPDDTVKTETISEGGTEEGLWPEENIPQDIPAYENYTEMYPVTYTDNDTAEEWYLSFDSTEKDYEAWINKLKSEGYKESDTIVGFWGNGEQILNLYTEEVDGEFCVSIDIFKSKPVEYPDVVSSVFPRFTDTDSTLYGWYVKEGEPNLLSIAYACGDNFNTDLTLYKQKLSDAGFTVTEDSATKEVNGKTYTVRYGDSVSRYEDCLEYEY